jgi:hypothetical protein
MGVNAQYRRVVRRGVPLKAIIRVAESRMAGDFNATGPAATPSMGVILDGGYWREHR